MRIFLSFHNDLSHSVATELHKFIPRVIQAAKPFIADQDMYSGNRWSDVIGNELYNSDYGIICLTRTNLRSPWILFEAGALSKALGRCTSSHQSQGVRGDRPAQPV
jgi:hypothetical protein